MLSHSIRRYVNDENLKTNKVMRYMLSHSLRRNCRDFRFFRVCSMLVMFLMALHYVALLNILIMRLMDFLIYSIFLLLISRQPFHQALADTLHILHSSIGFALRDESTVAIHILLESHQREKHGNDSELTHYTGVHHLHLKLEMLLSRAAPENVSNSRHCEIKNKSRK